MRLFVALQIPSELRIRIASLIKELREAAGESPGKGPQWVRADNLHLTLKFIGEVTAAKCPAICSALASLPPGEPIAVEFRGLGFFPNEKHPRVLWAGIEGSANLRALAASIERPLEQIGIPRDPRMFQPHLTLARFDSRGPNARLRDAIVRNADRVFGSLHAHEFHLIESKLKPPGAEYTTLQTFPFAEAEA